MKDNIKKYKLKVEHNVNKGDAKFTNFPKEAFYSLDTVLASFIRDALNEFTKYTQSYPEGYTHEEWIKKLSKIADEFDKYIKLKWNFDKSVSSDNMLKKLKKVFEDLWW